MPRISAVFDSQTQAEAAVTELRRMGLNDAHLSFVGQHGGANTAMGGTTTDGHSDSGDRGDNVAANTGKGLLAGAGVGALFGLAAAAIPGVGPFITAGVLASSLGTAAGGAVAGAIVGGATGSIAGALANAGYSHEEAQYYGAGVERGGTLVAIEDTHGLPEGTIYDVLQRHGGHVYGR